VAGEVLLRGVADSDLPAFCEHQQDPDEVRRAAFPPGDWDAFAAHRTKIMAGEAVDKKTILFDGPVAGNVVS
jgi:hypothetical protein